MYILIDVLTETQNMQALIDLFRMLRAISLPKKKDLALMRKKTPQDGSVLALQNSSNASGDGTGKQESILYRYRFSSVAGRRRTGTRAGG